MEQQEQQMGLPPGVSIEDLQVVKCECGSEIWDQGTKLKRLSAILSGDGQERLIGMPVIVCMNCKKEISIGSGGEIVV